MTPRRSIARLSKLASVSSPQLEGATLVLTPLDYRPACVAKGIIIAEEISKLDSYLTTFPDRDPFEVRAVLRTLRSPLSTDLFLRYGWPVKWPTKTKKLSSSSSRKVHPPSPPEPPRRLPPRPPHSPSRPSPLLLGRTRAELSPRRSTFPVHSSMPVPGMGYERLQPTSPHLLHLHRDRRAPRQRALRSLRRQHAEDWRQAGYGHHVLQSRSRDGGERSRSNGRRTVVVADESVDAGVASRSRTRKKASSSTRKQDPSYFQLGPARSRSRRKPAL